MDFDFNGFSFGGSMSLDSEVSAVTRQAPAMVRTASQTGGFRRVASLQDLDGFVRTGKDSLVHLATQDLWQLCQASDGGYFIKRLFDESTGPLKV